MLYLQPAVKLTTGEVALCDPADFAGLNRYRWRAITIHGITYAICAPRIDGKRVWLYMHQLVLPDVPPGMVRDHIDRNGLRNTRDNLRVCTEGQNRANARKRSGCRSRYIGVDVCHGRYRARVTPLEPGAKAIHLGLFDTEIQAARARDRKALELHGAFARLNLPLEP